MPVIGLLLGRQLSQTLGSHAHIIGGLLLIGVGAQTVLAATRSSGKSIRSVQGARMGRLLLLAAALSVDNLVVGFALGAYRAPVALSVAIIALVSVGLSLLGLELGNRLGTAVEHRSELIAGIVLFCVGVAILTGVL